ncbi:MAG: hypothetical protein K2X48_17155 [Chitinophagaceae bacterium]|nr:hypothetical protein [Chitinophagaceae bacterium]
MKTVFFFLFFVIIKSVSGVSQVSNKIFTLSLGYGYFNQIKKTDAGGNFWIQSEYKFSKSFSLAMEFENASFEIPVKYNSAELPNRQYFYDNSFAMLLKYYLPVSSKIQTSIGVGILYRLGSRDYYDSSISQAGMVSYKKTVEPTDALGFPVVLEGRYPFLRSLYWWQSEE